MKFRTVFIASVHRCESVGQCPREPRPPRLSVSDADATTATAAAVAVSGQSSQLTDVQVSARDPPRCTSSAAAR